MFFRWGHLLSREKSYSDWLFFWFFLGNCLAKTERIGDGNKTRLLKGGGGGGWTGKRKKIIIRLNSLDQIQYYWFLKMIYLRTLVRIFPLLRKLPGRPPLQASSCGAITYSSIFSYYLKNTVTPLVYHLIPPFLQHIYWVNSIGMTRTNFLLATLNHLSHQ